MRFARAKKTAMPAGIGILGILLLAITAVSAHGCSNEPDTARRQMFALGTLVDITLYPAPTDAAAGFQAVESVLREQEQRWRAWPRAGRNDHGELISLNRSLQAGESVDISPQLETGIRAAQKLAEQSGQRFNPAIGKLVETWQFHVDERPDAPPPDEKVIKDLVSANPTLDDLKRGESGKWHSVNQALYLDMGAFAKGLAVDAAADALLEAGIENGIVNAGGDLVALGSHGERAWRIGVRDPRGEGVLAAIEVTGRTAVFTSGNYERKFEYQGERYHHVLDPQTGYPARGTISMTVMHADAARADAAATALFVAGDGWRDVARAMNMDKVMRVDDEGNISITAAMRPMVSFPDGNPANLEVIRLEVPE